MIAIIATAIACFIVGGILSYILFRYVLKSKYDNVLKEAETEAEVIKKNKLLEVKEKFLNKKADLEKEVALRNQKIQQAENKLKQREMVLSQRQEEIQRKKMEAEAVKENLEAQLVIVDKKKDELDRLQQQEIEKLEAISGLSAEEAKERLVESLKEEAKTQAQSFINDIMDDAKLTASKEAKRIVIQSIQRVATETAIETLLRYSILNQMKSKDVLSDVKDVISVLWKLLPALKSLLTTLRKQSFFLLSTRFAVKLPAWHCISL